MNQMSNETFSKWHSLRFFLRNQLLILTGLIVAGFTVLIFYIYVTGVDAATQNSLRVIGTYYANLYEKGEFNQVSLETDEFSLFVGKENLPDWVRSRFPQERFENYGLVKDLNLLESSDVEESFKPIILLTAIPIDGGKRQLFATYHFQREQPTLIGPPRVLETAVPIIIGIFITLLMAVLWIAHRFNKKVLKPIETLTDMANKVDESSPDSSHPILQDRSEVGQVAQALQQGLERVHNYHQREKDFLQNASHELRTPITVVGTALDIIERRQALGKTDISKALKHIRQAANNMRETTNALLWLSREFDTQKNAESADDPSTPETAVLDADDIGILSENIVEELDYLIEGKDINVSTQVSVNMEIKDPALIRIVLTNLIRNAFEHTFSGKVDIQINDEGISVTDTGIGLNSETKWIKRGESSRGSFGLGLNIVSRIAEKKGWSLRLDDRPEGGCVAALCWG